MKNIVGVVKKLALSLSKTQKRHIEELMIECRKLGASVNSMAPFYGLVCIDFNTKLTKKEIEYGKRLARKAK